MLAKYRQGDGQIKFIYSNDVWAMSREEGRNY